MQFHFASLFAIIAAVGVAAQNLQINTPTNVIQCLPQLITWTGGEGPYFVSVLPGGQPGAAALVDFGEQSGTSLTWVVNIPAGTSIGLTIRDQTGTVANSAPFTVGSSSDTSCLSSSLSVSAGSSTAAGSTTATSAGATTTSVTSVTSVTSASSASSSSGATTTRASTSSRSATSSASSTTSSSAAMPFAEIGSAGVIGALVAALFA